MIGAGPNISPHAGKQDMTKTAFSVAPSLTGTKVSAIVAQRVLGKRRYRRALENVYAAE